MEKENLLKLRKQIKKKKPVFVVKESKFSSRVKSRWRFPRGKHSKVRQMHKGRPLLVGVGFSSPKSVKGLHHTGFEMVNVSNKSQLILISENQGAIISSGVGGRKKLSILEVAQEKGIKILNVSDISKEISKIKDELSTRKDSKQKKLKDKNKKEEDKKAALRKVEEKKVEEKKIEEKKKQENAKSESDLKNESKPESKKLADKKESDLADTEKDKERKIMEKTITKRQ
jgi:large subunit ribosomal protein L32e